MSHKQRLLILRENGVITTLFDHIVNKYMLHDCKYEHVLQHEITPPDSGVQRWFEDDLNLDLHSGITPVRGYYMMLRNRILSVRYISPKK